MHKAAQRARAVHLAGLDDFAGDADHELAHQKQIKGRKDHGQNHRPNRIQQPQGPKGHHAGRHGHLEGQHHQHQHQKEQRVAPAELEAAEGIGREWNHQRLPHQNGSGIQHAVAEQLQILRLFNQNGVVLPQADLRGRKEDVHPPALVIAAALGQIGRYLTLGEKGV